MCSAPPPGIIALTAAMSAAAFMMRRIFFGQRRCFRADFALAISDAQLPAIFDASQRRFHARLIEYATLAYSAPGCCIIHIFSSFLSIAACFHDISSSITPHLMCVRVRRYVRQRSTIRTYYNSPASIG